MEAPDSFATSVELQVTVVAVIPIVINASSHTCRRIRSNIVLFSLDDGNVTSLGKGLRDTALSKLEHDLDGVRPWDQIHVNRLGSRLGRWYVEA